MSKGNSGDSFVHLDIPDWAGPGRKSSDNGGITTGDGMIDLSRMAESSSNGEKPSAEKGAPEYVNEDTFRERLRQIFGNDEGAEPERSGGSEGRSGSGSRNKEKNKEKNKARDRAHDRDQNSNDEKTPEKDSEKGLKKERHKDRNKEQKKNGSREKSRDGRDPLDRERSETSAKKTEKPVKETHPGRNSGKGTPAEEPDTASADREAAAPSPAEMTALSADNPTDGMFSASAETGTPAGTPEPAAASSALSAAAGKAAKTASAAREACVKAIGGLTARIKSLKSQKTESGNTESGSTASGNVKTGQPEKGVSLPAFLTGEGTGIPAWQKNVLIGAVLLIAVLGSFAASQFYSHAQFYQDHFREGTTINGKDVSNKTVGEVEAALEKEALDYSLSLTFREGKTETLSREAFDFAYVSDGSVSELMERQDGFGWFLGLRRPDAIEAQTNTTFDEKALRDSLEELPELQEKKMQLPEDAKRSWDAKTNEFVIIPEKEGTQLDPDVVFEAACEAIRTGEKDLDVTALKGAYTSPSIRKDNAALVKETEQLNELAGASVTWHTPNGDVVLDGETLQDWLTKDKEGNYKRETYTWNTHIRNYVAELADSIDSFEKPRMFTTTSGEETEVDGNTYYGWEVDRDAEVRQLMLDLKAGRVKTREPIYLYREAAPMSDHDGVGDTYIEIDLSKQHLWMYQQGSLLLESDVISGKMTEGRHTPEGIFYPLEMMRNAVLRGTNGGETWSAPVSYWMKLTNDGVGLHDATWQWSWGGDFYIYNGSHGCINLPLDVAAQIYENLTTDTPVVVYYSQPYELYG